MGLFYCPTTLVIGTKNKIEHFKIIANRLSVLSIFCVHVCVCVCVWGGGSGAGGMCVCAHSLSSYVSCMSN
jgi:hypothetical protein